MELWVRSQDKMNLVQIKQININYQNNKQVIANYIAETYENAGEYYELLGTYKTKERALEVLDEIEGYIKLKYLYELKEYAAIKTIINGVDEVKASNNMIVYEMPEN